VQEFKLKKVVASKKKNLEKAVETKVAAPLPDLDEGICSDSSRATFTMPML